jgi:hypothetical protein
MSTGPGRYAYREVRLVRRERLSRGVTVVLLTLAIAAILALRAAATDPGGESGEATSGDASIVEPPPEKLHPAIRDWLVRRGAGDRERVIVTFQPGARLPESELATRHGARVLERFWINNSALVELPVGAIAAVAARPDVAYVQPEEGGEPPPG